MQPSVDMYFLLVLTSCAHRGCLHRDGRCSSTKDWLRVGRRHRGRGSYTGQGMDTRYIVLIMNVLNQQSVPTTHMHDSTLRTHTYTHTHARTHARTHTDTNKHTHTTEVHTYAHVLTHTHAHTLQVHAYYLTAHSHISSSTLQLKERGTFAPCRTMFTKADFTRFTSRPV